MNTMKKMLITGAMLSLVAVSSQAQIYVEIRPSRPFYTRTAPPAPGYIWVEEEWGPTHHGYEWRGGYWVRPRPGYRYRAGYWRHTHHGYVWMSGRWYRSGRTVDHHHRHRRW